MCKIDGCKHRKQRGFTLIELMIVVAIISILATLALPRFAVFQAKAKFTEAAVNIKTITTLYDTAVLEVDKDSLVGFDTGFGVDNGSGNPANSCNAANDLGFTLTNCEKVVFLYRIGDGNTNTSFFAIADGARVYSGCSSTVSLYLTYNYATRELFYVAGQPPVPGFATAIIALGDAAGDAITACQ